jgi:cbb3-type cytochrome oxidase subunit 3
MNKIKVLFLLFLLITFLVGIYFIFSANTQKTLDNKKEGFADDSCPDLLIQKGNVLMLYNTKQPMDDGKNPIPFFNLDEYINYLEIQRSKGINCPVLYLKQENNTQGEDVYRMRPSPFDLQGGLPAMVPTPEVKRADSSRDNPPYNANNFNSFDPQGLYVGKYTDLDKLHDSTKQNKISDNPMDPNWAGVIYTQQMVDSGKYVGSSITRPVLFTPKTSFYPTIPGPTAPPVDIL